MLENYYYKYNNFIYLAKSFAVIFFVIIHKNFWFGKNK